MTPEQQIEQLDNRINKLVARLELLEDWQEQHTGIDVGTVQKDVPHPFQKASVIEVNELFRLDQTGVQIKGGSVAASKAALSIHDNYISTAFVQEILSKYPYAAIVYSRLTSGYLLQLAAADGTDIYQLGVQTGPSSGTIGIFALNGSGQGWYIDDSGMHITVPLIPEAGGGGMELIVKDADETVNNSDTLQDDDDLLFAVAANEKWQFEGSLYVVSTATADFKLTFAGPSGSVGAFEVSTESIEHDTLGTARVVGLGAGTTEIKVTFKGAIANGGTAGSLKLQWAQFAATAVDTKVLAGSYIKYQKQ